MSEVVTAVGKDELLEELIKGSLWWIKQIEEDPRILELCEGWRSTQRDREIIDTFLFVSQYSRQLEKLADAQMYLDKAESHLQLLPEAVREEPQIIMDIGLQKIWLSQKQGKDCRADVQSLFKRQDLHDNR